MDTLREQSLDDRKIFGEGVKSLGLANSSANNSISTGNLRFNLLINNIFIVSAKFFG